jgi:hypothetical protein
MKSFQNIGMFFLILTISASSSFAQENKNVQLTRESSDSIQPTEAKIVRQNGVPIKNDFSLGPTKFIFEIDPGESKVVTLEITSRIEKDTNFEVGVEDFTVDEDPEKYTRFLENEKSQFSSKEWFKPATNTFSLKHGERMYLPVSIKVPYEVEAGEHYSAVFVKTVPNENENHSGITVSSRIGTLFLLKVSGETRSIGELTSFSTNKNIFFTSNVSFNLIFKNSGTVHLAPKGKITIKDIFGKNYAEINVKEWIVLRDSSRNQKVEWKDAPFFGIYTATTEVERGYENQKDIMSTSFGIFPAKQVVIGIIIISIVILLGKNVLSKFEIKRK